MKVVLGILTCLLLFSFSEPEEHYKKFKKWYVENASSLTKTLEQDEAKFELRFLPKEIKVVREIATKESVSSESIEELNEKYDAFYEFNFKISMEGVQDILVHFSSNEEEYNGLLFYLLEDISKEFTLVTSSESKKPLQCSYENNYGTAPFLSFHLVYSKTEGEKLEEFIFDNLLIGSEMSFELTELNELKIPKIK